MKKAAINQCKDTEKLSKFFVLDILRKHCFRKGDGVGGGGKSDLTNKNIYKSERIRLCVRLTHTFV